MLHCDVPDWIRELHIACIPLMFVSVSIFQSNLIRTFFGANSVPPVNQFAVKSLKRTQMSPYLLGYK
jgi:hypothetical protein